MKRNLASHFVVFGLGLAVLVAALVFGGHVFAAEPIRSPEGPTVKQAYDELLSVQFFAFGGVGFAGTTSEGEKAFRTVAASTNGLELFTAVLKHGNAQGQLYALCGIRALAREKFETSAKPLVTANRKVTTMSGCMGMEEGASNVVARISAGSYDAQIRNQAK